MPVSNSIGADFIDITACEVTVLEPDSVRYSRLPYVRMGDLQAFQERLQALQELMRMFRQRTNKEDRKSPVYEVMMQAAHELKTELGGAVGYTW